MRLCVVLGLLASLIPAGCGRRSHYRLSADQQSHAILMEKAAAEPWAPPMDFTIQPDPRSRFFDPTPLDDPLLPVPAPQLHAYEMPELPTRDPSRFRVETPEARPEIVPEPEPAVGPPVEASASLPLRLPSIRLVAHERPESRPRPQPPVTTPNGEANPADGQGATYGTGAGDELRINPIPKEVWESVPRSCLIRMFEFESVRTEYERTYKRQPGSELRDSAQRLALEDIIDLALINSREYQLQKETLYNAALRLTLSRYAYQLKFNPTDNGANGADANYVHNRDAGTTVNSLSVPTNVGGNAVLATGGQLLADFANSVMLEFNGDDGFSSTVGSEVLFRLSQSVLQRDIVFEGLTQDERNVVYAARDFARFRKQFFVDLASDYYSLILSYRRIEIGSSDFFSRQRAYDQREAEYQVGRRSLVEVDQVEQDALTSLGELIGQCNGLESSLDSLKILIGLPTEQPINLDLTELDILTLLDETTVAAELVRRARRNLERARNRAPVDRGTLVNFAISLTLRILSWQEFLERLDQSEGLDKSLLETLLARLEVDSAELTLRFNRFILNEDLRSLPRPSDLRLYRRTVDIIDSSLLLVFRQIELADKSMLDKAAIAGIRQRMAVVEGKLRMLRADVAKADEIPPEQRGQMDPFVAFAARARQIMMEVDALVQSGATLIGRNQRTVEQELQDSIKLADELLRRSAEALANRSVDLAPIELDMDDAMITALVNRFDLMNQRGELADFWRQIKLRGDDLRSVLNLNASQSIRSDSRFNRPFAFNFDDSDTKLSLSFDTPLNRRAERNSFRLSLINYNVALRNLVQAEDSIKLGIRNDLRNLQLDREQYRIAVAGAALGFNRVVSTRLQLARNLPGVATRDFLEAQNAYTANLSNVARRHIDYITDRIGLFFDLELLEVDVTGFWPDLYNDSARPTPHFIMPAGMPYGDLPRNVWQSKRIKRMLQVPPGQPRVYATARGETAEGAVEPAGPNEPGPFPPLPPPGE